MKSDLRLKWRAEGGGKLKALALLLAASAATFSTEPAQASENIREVWVKSSRFAIPQATINIQGRVVDDSGDPIVGASVRVKNSTQGTSTAADGSFSLDNVLATATIVISSVGYEATELPASASMQVSLLLDNTLEEIVVVGYGTQKKATVTGSVAEVKGRGLGQSTGCQSIECIGGSPAGFDCNAAVGTAWS